MPEEIKYPRRVLLRHLMRSVGRALLPLLSQPDLTGFENFPQKGPLILVGNHTGAMEAVMMALYPPRQVEFMGATDLPMTRLNQFAIDLYGMIPVFRGNVSRTSMKQALSVLKQGGVIGLFPEGGYWEPVGNRAHTGVAWLSYRAKAPVLPIGFGDTRGKLTELFKFKRPKLVMNVGKPLPPVELPQGKNRKQALQAEADTIMNAVWEIVPEDVKINKLIVENEAFEFSVEVYDQAGNAVEIPSELEISHGAWLSRFIHRINMINLMRDSLNLPIEVLKDLPKDPPLKDIISACQAIIDYAKQENPYFFTYRYGQKDGTAMLESFSQIQKLAIWVLEKGYSLKARPFHHYTDPRTQEHITRIDPVEFNIQ